VTTPGDRVCRSAAGVVATMVVAAALPCACVAVAFMACLSAGVTALAGAPRAAVAPGRPVDFEADVLPIFRRSCLACHNASRGEGDLVLETPARILAGGASGPAVLPGKGEESPLVRLAAHRDEPVMPPDDNDRAAPRLTAAELGIVSAWIDAGAKGEVRGGRPLVWQPPAADRQPVHAVAVSADGLVVAAGRADRILLFETFSGAALGPLVDPALPAAGLGRAGAAHVSGIESLAFSPDGMRLASGDFRTVKVWKRGPAAPSWRRPVEATITAAATVGRRVACGCADGRVLVFDEEAAAPVPLAGHVGGVTAIAADGDGGIVTGGADGTIRRWDLAAGREIGRIDAGGSVAAVAALGGAGRVAAAVDDGSLRAWPLPAGPPGVAVAAAAEGTALSEGKVLAAAGSGIVCLAAADAAGGRLAAGSGDGTVRLYDVETGKELGRAEAGGVVTALAAAPAAARLAAGTSAGRVTILEVDPAGTLKPLSKAHSEPVTAAAEIDPLEFSKQRAGQVVATAREDLDLAVKDRDAERSASYAAILEVAKTEIDLAKKEAAVVEPAKALALATEAADKARAAAAAATAIAAKADEATAQQAKAEQTKAEQAHKAADEAVAKARAAADDAAAERTRAAEAHAGAKLTVERVAASVTRAVAAAATAQEAYDAAKEREKQAGDELALAARGRAAAGERFDRLATRTVGGSSTGAAGAGPPDAIPAESLRGIEAAARGVDEAEMAALRSTMQAMTLVQRSEDGRKMAEQTAGEADKAVAAARTALEQAAKEVDAARQKMAAAGDDEAKTLRAAELAVAETKAATAREDLAAAESRLARVTAAREAAAAAATQAVPEAESITAEADRRLAEARRRFEEATAAARQSSGADARAVLERQLGRWQRERAAATLVEARRPVVGVALAADGKEAVFVDDAGSVRRILAADGQPLGRIETGGIETGGGAVAVTVAADGRLVVVGPHAVGRWPRSDRWTLERQLGGPADATSFTGVATSLAFSPDGSLLAAGGGVPSRAGEITLWRVATGERLAEMPQPPSDAVLALEFSPAGELLAAASADRTVRVYDVASRSQLHGFEGHAQHVLGVAWRADGRLLASAAADGVVKSWDLQRGELRKSLPPLAGEATGVRYLAAGDTLVASAADGRVHTRTSDGGNAKSFGEAGPCLHAIAVSRMGRVIAAGREDGGVQLWDAAGKPIATFAP